LKRCKKTRARPLKARGQLDAPPCAAARYANQPWSLSCRAQGHASAVWHIYICSMHIYMLHAYVSSHTCLSAEMGYASDLAMCKRSRSASSSSALLVAAAVACAMLKNSIIGCIRLLTQWATTALQPLAPSGAAVAWSNRLHRWERAAS